MYILMFFWSYKFVLVYWGFIFVCMIYGVMDRGELNVVNYIYGVNFEKKRCNIGLKNDLLLKRVLLV